MEPPRVSLKAKACRFPAASGVRLAPPDWALPAPQDASLPPETAPVRVEEFPLSAPPQRERHNDFSSHHAPDLLSPPRVPPPRRPRAALAPQPCARFRADLVTALTPRHPA